MSQGWFAAHAQTVRPLLVARGLLDVLHVAERTGLLTALREPSTTAALVTASGLDEPRLRPLLRVLVVHEVVELAEVVEVAEDAGRAGDAGPPERLRLTDAWRELTSDGAFVALADLLAAGDVERAAIRSLGGSGDYWEIAPEQRLAFARSVSPNPYRPALVEAVRAAAEHDPDLDVLRAGGTLLELGCGVAGRLLTTLQAVPSMRAVGVELSPDLADEARRRARELGVDDRLEVVTGDAADLDRPDAFDAGFWSQFFFPAPAREPALRTALRCLRPGAVLVAPVGGAAQEAEADPHGAEARARSVLQVLLGSWGVPERSTDELVDELRAAGFVDVGPRERALGGTVVRAVRP